jgi:alkylated DNA repair protein (DNA oxidative demethylase)
LDRPAQEALRDDIRACLARAPLFQPETARGRKMSVRISSAGEFGWISDRRGYRYEPRHPSGVAWPPIPDRLLTLWDEVTGHATRPDSCLINWYSDVARMGLHQDRDETDITHPVLSVSLGDDALFRIGGAERTAPTRSVWLSSGDVLVLGGAARQAFHGIDRLRPGSSTLLRDGGRLNLTLRVAG